LLGPVTQFKLINVYILTRLVWNGKLIPNWSERLSECEGRVVKQNGKEMKEELTLLVSICSQFGRALF
jgi:hypothetical protein